MGVNKCVFFSDGKAIVVGGMSIDTNPKDHMMAYDLELNRWHSLPPMPTARYATSSFLINDKLYVIGKSDFTKYFTKTSYKPPLPNTHLTPAIFTKYRPWMVVEPV